MKEYNGKPLVEGLLEEIKHRCTRGTNKIK